MSSEPTERQAADEDSVEKEAHSEEPQEEPSSGETDRLEARATAATRVDADERDDGEDDANRVDEPGAEGGDDAQGVVPAPSDAGLEESSVTEDEAEAGESDASLEEASSDVLEEDSEPESAASLAEETSEPTGPHEDALDLPEFDDLEGQATEWLDGLFERMNLDSESEFSRVDGEPRVDIHGPDADRLLGLGKLGPKALEGVETLLHSVFSEDDEASDVYVDVDGKRAERKSMLEDVGVRMADSAVRLGETLTVSGLNSTERRIIHRRLRDHDGVDTESVGDGIFRRLKIDPS